MNAHSTSWSKHPHSNSTVGRTLQMACSRMGLVQRVGQPTRGAYLLDLVLTDINAGVACKVLPQIADHIVVLAKVELAVQHSPPIERDCWDYRRADWN
eukprot:6250921-Pyramimonas_sp.AAC.1